MTTNNLHRVSVIIPAYNAASSIRQCLNSVFHQTHRNFEVIVINDGSTDQSENIIHSYGDGLTYIKQTNQGQGAARNAGLKTARGEYVAFLDADDYWKPSFLRSCIDFLTSHPECIAVNTGLIIRMHDGSEVTKPDFLLDRDAPDEPFVIEDFYAFWAKNDHVRTGSAVIRKKVIDKAGGQRADLRVSQDLEYWGYIATFGRWGYIPEPLWVGNSRAAAASGWLAKYRARRKLCPTMESWQERIMPRLDAPQLRHFKVVRGRVAAGFAHNHILGGNFTQAKHIVETYGLEMAENRLTRLLNGGLRAGRPGWKLACLTVILHEYVKAVFLGARARFSSIRL